MTNPLFSTLVFVVGLVVGVGAAYIGFKQLVQAKVAEASAGSAAELRAANTRAQDLSTRLADAESHLRVKDSELRGLDTQLTSLKTERATFDARVEELSRVHERMKDSFGSLAAEALKSTSDSFFKVAKNELEAIRSSATRDLDDKERAFSNLIAPIRDGLQKYDAKLEQLARDRDESMGRITGQLQRVEHSNAELAVQTQHLARALRSPAVRGRWGEMQLRRVIEIAGMVEHCDFSVQPLLEGEDGARLRPDVLVKLPGGRAVAIDAKVPLTAYLEAIEDPNDESRKIKLKQHAQQLRAHSDSLGKKNYWQQLDDSPEFVVLFLPSEVFFSTALEQDGQLIDDSFTRNRVIIATPTTLIALLHAVAYGWRQESLARSAEEIAELGRELYERLSKFDEHIGDLGGHLEKAMKFYNSAVGTLESRVLVSARRFKDLGVGSSTGDLAVLEPIELPVRSLKSTELTDGVVE
jgi:DNA recombination protein RmuC